MDKPIFTNRSLARLIGPLILEQLLAVTIGMADTIMVTAWANTRFPPFPWWTPSTCY